MSSKGLSDCILALKALFIPLEGVISRGVISEVDCNRKLNWCGQSGCNHMMCGFSWLAKFVYTVD